LNERSSANGWPTEHWNRDIARRFFTLRQLGVLWQPKRQVSEYLNTGRANLFRPRIKPMSNEAEMRHEIAHLRVLAAQSTDSSLLAEIELLIQELEERLRNSGNGSSIAVAPAGSLWWPEAIKPAA
jgi:hypothetical protein